MEKDCYELQWPRDGLFIDCFAHEIMNYRYHWHTTKYELNILLHGNQEFCRGAEALPLEENDIILVEPGVGHASFAQRPNTRALVLHFSASAFKPYVKKGFALSFPECRSNADNRDEVQFKLIRFYAAQVFQALYQGGPYVQLTAKGCMEMLFSTLCRYFQPQSVKAAPEQDEHQHEVIRHLIVYLEQHYNEKITLEDLASFSQYNRTYISTLFKNIVGVNFHQYLTRLRFQNALLELATTEKNLTEIALDNGFSDLKTFNACFKDILHRSPSVYRSQLSSAGVPATAGERKYVSGTDKLVSHKLEEYTNQFV